MLKPGRPAGSAAPRPRPQELCFELLRRLSRGGKLQRVAEMMEMAHAMAEAQVRRQ